MSRYSRHTFPGLCFCAGIWVIALTIALWFARDVDPGVGLLIVALVTVGGIASGVVLWKLLKRFVESRFENSDFILQIIDIGCLVAALLLAMVIAGIISNS